MSIRHPRHLVPVLVSLATLGAAAAAADSAARVADLLPGAGGAVPSFDAVSFDGALLFRGRNGDDFALWSYDAVSPPAVVAGGGDLAPERFAVWNGAVYFTSGSFTPLDRELWVYDGLTTPHEDLDLAPAGSSFPQRKVVFGSRLCFAAEIPTQGQELVCWDGASNPELFDIRAGAQSSSPDHLVVFQGSLYFRAIVNGVGAELFRYDGNGAPALAADLRPGSASSDPERLTVVGDELFFSARDADDVPRLWRFDGIDPPQLVSASLRVSGALAAFRNRLHVFASDDVLGTSDTLWRLEGATPVKVGEDGVPTLVESTAELAGALYFIEAGGDVFRYTGVGVVQRVITFPAITDYAINNGLVRLGDRLYFAARDAASGEELWALTSSHVLSDGFESGDTEQWSAVVP